MEVFPYSCCRAPVPRIEASVSFLQGERSELSRSSREEEEEELEEDVAPPPLPAPRARQKIEAQKKVIRKPRKEDNEDTSEEQVKPEPEPAKKQEIVNIVEPIEQEPKVQKKLERQNTFIKEDEVEVKEDEEKTEKANKKIEPIKRDLPKRVATSLDPKSATKLDAIVKNRAKSRTKDKESSRASPKPVKKINSENNMEETNNKKDEEKEEKQQTPVLKKKRSILKSLSSKHVGSEESADLAAKDKTKTKEQKNTAEENKANKEKPKSKEEPIVKIEEPTPKKKPLSFAERGKQLLRKGSVKKDVTTQGEKDAVKDVKGKDSPAIDEDSSEQEMSDDEDTVDSEEDSEEDDETGEEDSEDEDSSEGDDDDLTTATEATTTRGLDTSASDSQPVGKTLSVLPDLHRVETAGSDSHDSEGVIVRKSPLVKKTSVPSKDNIIIVVSDFEAAKDAAFINDDNVSQLYVEYKFLDIPVEDLETPFSLPKPAPQEKISFNFRKVFAVDRTDNSARRRLVSKMLRAEDESARLLTFQVT